MNTKILTAIFCSICLLSTACGILGGSSGGGDMNSIFADMENGIRNDDESLFKKNWSADTYDKNVVGRSGLEGSQIFKQGSRKKWFPKPDFSNRIKVGSIEIIPAEIWSWEKERKVDEVYFAIKMGSSPVILGGGEDLEEVKKLAERADQGKSLDSVE
jgi:hypothetical protein